MRAIRAEPIDPARYAPYGSVVRAGEGGTARTANHGTAQAWDALATLVNLRGEAARCTASLFRCLAHVAPSLEVRLLERHAGSTQMFVPMRASRYLVVVALGEEDGRGEGPDLATLAAFVVEGPQAITYAPGVWHHPMVALDEDADFVNVIHSDGTSGDCDERAFDGIAATVAIPART